MLVKEIMNKAIAVDHDISIKEASGIMSKSKIGSLIILKDSSVIGIITEKDLAENVGNSGKKISAIMSKNVIKVSPYDDLDIAAELMSKNKIKRLPVLDNGKLVGIITASDLIAHIDELEEDFFIE